MLCGACGTEVRAQLRSPFRAEQGASALPLCRPVAGDGPGWFAQDVLELPAVLPVVAAGVYAAELAAAILAFKDHGRVGLVRTLRPGLMRALHRVPDLVLAERGHASRGESLVAVPVPGSIAGFRRRGLDPLAELLGAELPPGWSLDTTLLARRAARPGSRVRSLLSAGSGAQHAGATSAQRRRALHGAFVPARGAAQRRRGRTVVLVDDVMTTGSTLAAASAALAAGGVQVRAAVVLAAVAAPDGAENAERPRG